MSLPTISANRRDARIAGGIIARLARDTSGNTLILVAAALLPLLAMVGSGIDMGRGYLAQARLQQACDAAALAGRRAMTGGVVDATVTDEAKKFFKFNFETGSAGVDSTAAFGSKGFTPVVGSAANSTVTVAAATTLPTTVMKIFGFATLPLSVNCFAKQDFVNTDIALVLDTTGSMKEDVNGNDVGGGASSKIVGLRNAVMALYDQLAPVQTQLEAQGLRLRYSIVPYSSAVNIGEEISRASQGHLADIASYQTRVGNYTTPVYAPQGAAATTVETYGSAISAENCLKYGYNQPFSGFTPNPAGEPITAGSTLTYYLPSTWGGLNNIAGTGNKTCVRNRTLYSNYTTRYVYTSTGYQKDNVDTSRFKTGASTSVAIPDGNAVFGGSVAASGAYDGVYLASATNVSTNLVIPTGVTNGVLNVPARIAGTTTTGQTAPSTTSYTWSGENKCIEERQTVSTITSSSGYAIPSGAYDLNIDYIPNSNETRWAPHWPEMIWYRATGLHAGESRYNNTPIVTAWGTGAATKAYYACPSAAVRLKAFSRTAMQTYVDDLEAVGGTYHDIGMIWGARMLSAEGIFGADNPASYGGMPMSRFIIFLTDGQMAPNDFTYTTYGVEYLDQRITGSASVSGQTDDHTQRMKMICNAAKSKGVSIWVIAFATALNSSLTECASNPGQASTSNSQSDLINKFTEIGRTIGALRLTQ